MAETNHEIAYHARARRPIIGVMGAGENASESALRHAYALGQLIAQEGWILLNGGRNCGVMDASARGAKEANGLVVGILPDTDMRRTSQYVDIPILTRRLTISTMLTIFSSASTILKSPLQKFGSEVTVASTILRSNSPEERPPAAFLKASCTINRISSYSPSSADLACNIRSTLSQRLCLC